MEMHLEAVEFLARMSLAHAPLFKGTRVVEAGSLNINGSARHFFVEPAQYTGVDWQPGKCVDVVSRFHEFYGYPDGHFDVAISTEMLEHDPHWAKSVKRMVDLVRPGGAILITCAGPGRAPHHLETAPDVKGYYENRSPGAILYELDFPNKAGWAFIHAEYDSKAFDTRVFVKGKTK